ncbi:MAG: 7-cyano-7-deazaguanine synthase QueC [Candidatus Aminicenantes bacterium]|nr:7-cyano-7-deazaguanine synthase QueC [Candidatus Aminicenantes bacterium]
MTNWFSQVKLLEKRPGIFYHREGIKRMKKCMVLFSGGIDSTTALFWAKKTYDQVHALTFDYGQRHKIEIKQSRYLIKKIRIPQTILTLDMKQIKGSCLTDNSIPVPEYSPQKKKSPNLPSSYVPFRNGILLSFAAAWGEVNGIYEIVCGFNVIDSPDYPDTRKEFVDAMETSINTGTSASHSENTFKLKAPFIQKKKSEIIKWGLSQGADYSHSISCYSGGEIPCLKCPACHIRQKAWEEAGLKDHLIKRLEKEGKL